MYHVFFIHIFQLSQQDYMTELVMDEVAKVEEESLIFRENTIGTKSVEAFLRLVGMKYLHETLGKLMIIANILIVISGGSFRFY